MSFRVGGGQQRGAHRAARQAEQVKCRLGHHRALVAEQPVVHRDELVVDLPGAGHVARGERVDHLVQPVADHVADHADETDRAQGEPRQVQHVGTAVIDKVGAGQHVRRGARGVLGVLDADDPGMGGQPDQGLGGDGRAGPAGNVVDEHGQAGGVGDRGEMGLERGLGRLVVIGSHHQQAIDPGPFGCPGQFDGVGGDVGADPGHHLGPRAHRLEHHPEQALLLGVGRGRRLTGGAVQHQPVVAHVGDEIVGEAGGPVVVDGPVGSHGRNHRRHHLAERRRIRRHTRTLPATGCAE